MNDSQFDDFFNDKLRGHAAPVPKGLWEKVSEGQFDQFVGGKLREAETPVPDGLWEKVADAQFDNFVGDKLFPFSSEAAVPAGLWDKITDGQFDTFVGDKLRDHEAPVPAGLWEKVRPDEEDDRVGFFWFRYPAVAAALLGVLLAGAIGGYIYFNAKKKTPVENVKTIHPQNINSDHGKSALPSAPANDRTTLVVPPVAGNHLTNQVPDPATGKASADQLLLSSRNPVNANPTLSLKPVNAANKNGLTNNPYDIFKNNAITGSNSSDKSPGGEEEDIPSYQSNHLTGFTVPSGIENLNGMMRDIAGKQLSTLNHTSQFRNVIICPTGGSGNPDWYLEVYASPNIAFKSVNNISASQQYLTRKDSSESSQIGYSAGVRLVKPIGNNILLKAGVEYTQANQKYVYRTENEVKTTTVVTVRTIIRAPGDTVVVQDTSVLQTIGFRNNTVKNHYRTVDIPITIGYQFGDDDLKFAVNAGVVVNLTSWYQGVMLDSTLATVTLNKSGNMVYKSNIGLGLIGSFSVVKRLSDDMHIFFEPYFRYNLSNMTTSQSSFSQRFSLGGLAVGLRFNLNRK